MKNSQLAILSLLHLSQILRNLRRGSEYVGAQKKIALSGMDHGKMKEPAMDHSKMKVEMKEMPSMPSQNDRSTDYEHGKLPLSGPL